MVGAVNSKETGTIPASRILKPFWRLTCRSSFRCVFSLYRVHWVDCLCLSIYILYIWSEIFGSPSEAKHGGRQWSPK